MKQETDEATIHWTNQGNKKEDYVGIFFKELEESGLDGTKRYQYAPDGYSSLTKAVELMDDIFSAETSIGELYLLSLENQFGEKGYELYRYTGREDYGSESAKNLIDRYLNPKKKNASDGFMNIPDGIDEELPFN